MYYDNNDNKENRGGDENDPDYSEDDENYYYEYELDEFLPLITSPSSTKHPNCPLKQLQMFVIKTEAIKAVSTREPLRILFIKCYNKRLSIFKLPFQPCVFLACQSNED